MHRFTLRYASHPIPILSAMLSLYLTFLNLNYFLPFLCMHVCMHESGVLVVYKHVIHVRNVVDGVEPYKV